jgi:hypothetical protein
MGRPDGPGDAGWKTHTGDAFAEAQAAHRARMEKAATFDVERRRVLDALNEKETEKDRVIALYRRGRITDADKAQEALARAAEEHLMSVASMLSELRENLDVIEATNDVAAKAEYTRMLVREVVVTSTSEERPKQAAVAVRYLFNLASVAVLGNPSGFRDTRMGKV